MWLIEIWWLAAALVGERVAAGGMAAAPLVTSRGAHLFPSHVHLVQVLLKGGGGQALQEEREVTIKNYAITSPADRLCPCLTSAGRTSPSVPPPSSCSSSPLAISAACFRLCLLEAS